jgi:hypothetical protein
MRSEKQIAASRLNGAKSRGPVAAAKDRIRTNALKHGLTARVTLWQNEDPRQFHALLLTLLERFAPTDDLEFLCIEEMAMAKWRSRRVATLEAAAGNQQLAAHPRPESSSALLAAFTSAQSQDRLLSTLRQHETSHARAYQRAYRHLLELRQSAGASSDAV